MGGWMGWGPGVRGGAGTVEEEAEQLQGMLGQGQEVEACGPGVGADLH